MAERSHIIGSPPEGGRFRLVEESGHVSFVGMMTVGLAESKTEREEEVNLYPGTGTKVVFANKPELLVGGQKHILPVQQALLCLLDYGPAIPVHVLLFPFPYGALRLDWFAPGQELQLFAAERHKRNAYYPDIC